MAPNLGIFILSQNVAFRQIWGCWFLIWKYYYFQIPATKCTNKAFFDPKFKNFYFCTKLCNYVNSSVLISKMTVVFSNSNSKLPKLDIFGPKLRIFIFAQNFSSKTIFLFHAFNICVHKDSCIFRNQSQITKSEK